jgi:histidinol-phosphate aminotransferase
VEPACVILGNGSTEILDVATRTFVDRGDEVVIHVPTYAFFETQAGSTAGGRPRPAQGQPASGAIVRRSRPKNDLPVQPDARPATGGRLTMRAVLAADVGRGRPGVPGCGCSTSFAPLVLTIRTSSSPHHVQGLQPAALRVGYGVAHPALIDTLLRVRIPFSLSLVALRAGLAAFADPEVLEERRRYISDERDRVFRALASMPTVKPYPSDGNFILVDISGTGRTATQIVAEALEERVLLRAMTAHRLQGAFVRVTIGTTEQNLNFGGSSGGPSACPQNRDPPPGLRRGPAARLPAGGPAHRRVRRPRRPADGARVVEQDLGEIRRAMAGRRASCGSAASTARAHRGDRHHRQMFSLWRWTAR